MNEPAYVVVYTVLKREIADGDYPIGSLIPPEPELEKRFSVSRTTIRRAVELLAREGYLLAQRGLGTVVLDYKTRQNLNVITSMSTTLRNRGFNVEAKELKISIEPCTKKIASELNILEGESVAKIERVLHADGIPIAILVNYVVAIMVPNIESRTAEITSLYRFLEERYNFNIESANDKISARNADASEAKKLDVAIGTALLYLRRVCYNKNRPIIVDRVTVVGERYELDVAMFGREK